MKIIRICDKIYLKWHKLAWIAVKIKWQTCGQIVNCEATFTKQYGDNRRQEEGAIQSTTFPQ